MEVAIICLQWLAIIFLAWRQEKIVKQMNHHTTLLLHNCIKVCEDNEWYELAQILKDRIDGSN